MKLHEVEMFNSAVEAAQEALDKTSFLWFHNVEEPVVQMAHEYARLTGRNLRHRRVGPVILAYPDGHPTFQVKVRHIDENYASENSIDIPVRFLENGFDWKTAFREQVEDELRALRDQQADEVKRAEERERERVVLELSAKYEPYTPPSNTPYKVG